MLLYFRLPIIQGNALAFLNFAIAVLNSETRCANEFPNALPLHLDNSTALTSDDWEKKLNKVEISFPCFYLYPTC